MNHQYWDHVFRTTLRAGHHLHLHEITQVLNLHSVCNIEISLISFNGVGTAYMLTGLWTQNTTRAVGGGIWPCRKLCPRLPSPSSPVRYIYIPPDPSAPSKLILAIDNTETKIDLTRRSVQDDPPWWNNGNTQRQYSSKPGRRGWEYVMLCLYRTSHVQTKRSCNLSFQWANRWLLCI